MKTAYLREIGLDEKMIKIVMRENGKDIKKVQKRIELKDEDISEILQELNLAKKKLSELNNKVQKIDNIKEMELKNKLVEVGKYYENQSIALVKECAMEKLFGEVAFASKLAKKAAKAEFINRAFSYENGSFLGAEEFFIELRQEDPNSFI